MATASDLVKKAVSQIGVKESPANSNKVKYNTWYYGKEVSGSSYPWCMVFVQWVFDQVGVSLPKRTASCGDLMRAAQSKGMWVEKDFLPGDVLIFDFPGGAATDHCGILESVLEDSYTSIEGNTSINNDSNGGEVMRRGRYPSQIVGAVRPVYDEDGVIMINMTKDELKKLIKEVIEEVNPTYKDLKDVPEYWKSIATKLLDQNIVNGGTSSSVNATDLNLKREVLQAVVISTLYHDNN